MQTQRQQNIQHQRDLIHVQIQLEKESGTPYFDSFEAVYDPVITPFLRALKTEGFVLKIKSECIETHGVCSSCRKYSLYTHLRELQTFHMCPLCDG